MRWFLGFSLALTACSPTISSNTTELLLPPSARGDRTESVEVPVAPEPPPLDSSSPSSEEAPEGLEARAEIVAPGLSPATFRAPLPDVAERLRGAASRFANLSPQACAAELSKRALPFRRVGAQSGIATPLRFTGPLGDVTFRVPPDKSPYGLLDCRLALVLAEIVPSLRAHEIKTVRIDNFYRPRARLPRQKGSKSQHAYGLAADLVSLVRDDGLEIDVERDFHGEMGEPVCGPDAFLEPDAEAAIVLRNLVCEWARRGDFHHILTPNYDRAHRNHLHLDIKRDNKWFSVR